MIPLPIRRLPHAEGLPLPRYETDGAAGLDLLAANAAEAPIVLPPWGRALVPTGLVLGLPEGYEAQVRPRSGLALNHGVTVLNAPGTIDADYRGEVQVLLVNLGAEPFTISRGARIAASAEPDPCRPGHRPACTVSTSMKKAIAVAKMLNRQETILTLPSSLTLRRQQQNAMWEI